VKYNATLNWNFLGGVCVNVCRRILTNIFIFVIAIRNTFLN
jgi:hypothetical protein